MTGYLNSHGTCPSAFTGQFLSWEEGYFPDEKPQGSKSNWVAIDEIGPGHVADIHGSHYEARDTLDRLLDEDDGYYYRSVHSVQDGQEQHFREMAEDAHMAIRLLDFNSIKDREKIVAAWSEARYSAYYETGPVRMKNRTQPLVDSETLPSNSRQYGCIGANRGKTPWEVIDEKEHKTWMNRRRGKGRQRAPDWQQKAGWRRKVRQAVREKRIISFC